MKQSIKRQPGSLKARVILTMCVIVLVLIGIVARQAWVVGFDSVRNVELARVQALVNTLAPRIDGQSLALEAAPLAQFDAFTKWDEAPAGLLALHQQLAVAASANEIESPVYILLPRPGRLEEILASPNEVHGEALVFSVTSAPVPYWFHRYEYRPEMAPTLLQGRASHTDVYEDEHGGWISAYAAIENQAGEVIGLLEADAPLQKLLAAFYGDFEQNLLLLLGWSVLGALAVLLALVPIEKAFERLLAISRCFTAGDYETPIEPFGARETFEISTAFEKSRRHIRDHAAELVARKEETENALRVKQNFLMAMNHEFRTPLNGIVGAAESLHEQLTDSQCEQALELLNDSVLRMTKLVDSTLLMVDIQDKDVPLRTATFELEPMLLTLTRGLERDAQRGGLQLDVQLSACQQTCQADHDKLAVAIENLLGNAIKYTPAGGKVELTVAYDEIRQRLQVGVSDNGPGLSDSDQKRIFEPFVQVQQSATRAFDGAGVGLTIAQHYVRALGGQLALQSELGAGCLFEFEIPLTLCTPLPSSALPDSMTILLVEDNPVNRCVLERSLTKHGIEVILAENGLEAVERWRANRDRLQMILMDLQMPVMDGLQATEIIRAEEQELGLTATPILAVTADTRPGTRATCMHAGMNGYLTKPVRRKDLIESIGQVFSRSRGERSQTDDSLAG